MFESSCLDLNGNTLCYLTQWDLNQQVMFSDLDLTVTPVIHFHSKMLNKDEAVSVIGALEDGNVIVDVPNFLLQKPYPITIHVCQAINDSLTTVLSATLPVRAKDKPSDYKYVENISSISVMTIQNELEIIYNQKADKTYVDSQVRTLVHKIDTQDQDLEKKINTKADKTYVDNALEGSPKGIFTTATDLSGKEAGMYLNSTDGYIYHWDGTTLSDAIVQYQAVQIAVKSIIESMLSDELAYKALEERRTFASQSALETYLTSAYAKAGQIVKVYDSEEEEYQVYILQNTDGGLTTKKINSDEEALNTMVGADLSFDEATRELSLLNLLGEEIGNKVTITAGIDGLNMEIEDDPDDETKKYLVLLDSGMNELARTQLPMMGGGTTSTQMRLRNGLDSTTFTIPYNETDGCSCILKYTFTSVDSDGYETGNGTATYYVGGAEKAKTQNLKQGETEFDIGEYLTVGKTNTVKVQVVDAEGTKKSITYYITVSQNYISSTFATITKQTGNFTVPFTAVGSGEKTVHFLVDGEEVGTEVNPPSNRERFKEIQALSHGSHTLEIYMTTILEGYTDPIPSNKLTFGIVAIEEGNTEPILLMMDVATEVLQYSTLEIPFLLYDPANTKCDVVCSVDGEEVTMLSVTSEARVWNYRMMVAGEHTLAITYKRNNEDASDDVSKSIVINATEVKVAQAETAGLKFYFNAANRSNDEPNPAVYEYTNSDGETYSMTFNNMNFTNDGWTGQSLDIGVGSSVDINCQPFATDVNATIGKTIEFNFKAKNVYNFDSLIISCFANSKGIQITPNNGSLAINSENGIEIQYKDEEEVKISFVITHRNSENEGQKQLIYVYVNSDIAGIIKYGTSDNFAQLDKPYIHIGSDEAGIELYNIRYYEVELSSYQILDNYIADTPDPIVMLERNARNDIFDGNNEVDYEKLPDNCPYLIICCPRLPDYKGDVIKNVYGRFVDNLHPERSFTFTGAEIDVQGTTSAGYYVKNFKIKFKGGFILITVDGEENVVTGYSIYDDTTDVPVSVFCYKADVASSEGANNLILMKIWEATVPYKTPPQQTEYTSKGYNTIRQSIDGRPIVLFWENSETGELSFRGKYNFNNDKSTAETFGFVDDAEHNCQCWEFRDNGLELTEFRGDDFDSLNVNGKPVWQDAFEARFPDKYEDTTKLRRVVSWVASTNTLKATGSALDEPYTDVDGNTYDSDTAEYRLAKFKTEFEDYFVKTPTLFYYLFTDLFLMVDSRAKNQFITTWDGVHWLFLPYDADTALGTDNMGALKFGYWLEDTDQVNGTDVYNGQPSVLWKNVKAVFHDDIAALAQEAVSGNLNYEYVLKMFTDHQAAWSEAIFCADTVVKYINPYLETATEAYLKMAQGSKKAQRAYWLFNRFNYWCSKFHVGSARKDFITLRMSEPKGDTVNYVPLDMTLRITPYSHLYIGTNFGQALQLTRGYPDEVSVIESGLDRPGDSPVYIFSASQLRDIGDLSAAYVQYVDIGTAINLERIVVGSPIVGYKNEKLESLSIGNNKKLRLIDVRNCVNLTGEIKAGLCNNIEEIYTDNTRITSVTLPVGGTLKVMRLPDTIESLTIRKQQNIEELYIAGYDKLATLYIDDCPTINVMDILEQASNLTHVRLTDVDWDLDDTTLLDRLLALGGVSENGSGTIAQSVLTGVVHVPIINTAKMDAYNAAWKDLTITYDTFIEQYPVTFQNDDGRVLGVQYVDRGSKAVEPIEAGLFAAPTKASTIDKVFTFNGWDTNLDVAVISAITVTATYIETARQYTVQYVVEGEVVQSTTVDVYSTVKYTGDTPTKTGMESSYIWYLFSGWDSEAVNITSDMTITALFEECVLPSQIADVTQFDFLYTNNPEHTSAYTLPQLYAICKSDRFKDYLAVGDEIEILLDTTVINDESIIFQVYGFNHYELAESTTDNVQMAHVVFGMKGVLVSGRRINPSNTNAGGWDASEMRTWLNETIFNVLPVMLQNMIESVQVLASAGTQSSSIVTSIDKLFLFSESEVGFSTSAVPYKNEISANAENVTFALFTDSASRIKKTFNGEGSAQYWWLRSPDASSTTTFRDVNYGGNSGGYNASYNYSVAVGFCA